ncbi:uncharacterized protein LOC129583334 [Paramacrobiotus metropolitanus]|uniref:uncharacterized protein LOC129583334 n=1 Tax=Paramacrobiotus metropolitanus TaxID=2943436 RepID=UPI002445CE9B|nr:uncharacterized protein LOC129583334 [Paramacrobiotus metropolitanus]
MKPSKQKPQPQRPNTNQRSTANPHKPSVSDPSQMGIPSVCQQFNRNQPCGTHPCMFTHQCLFCHGHHSALECRFRAPLGDPSPIQTSQPEPPPPYTEVLKPSTSRPVVANSTPPTFLPGACRQHNTANGCNAKNCKHAHICGYCSRTNHIAQNCPFQDDNITQASTSRGTNNPAPKSKSGNNTSGQKDAPCRYYNAPAGCRNVSCKFSHKCSSCGKLNHGADNCNSSTKKKPDAARASQKKIVFQTAVGTFEIPQDELIDGTCFDYNRRKPCKKSPCPYDHDCCECGRQHDAIRHLEADYGVGKI